jgi:ATP-dependent Lon protease
VRRGGISMNGYKAERLAVLPIWNILLVKNLSSKVVVNKDIGKAIEEQIAKGRREVIGLMLKEKHSSNIYKANDFYRVGKLLEITLIERVGDRYKLSFTTSERIEVKSLVFNENEITAEYESFPDIDDLSESDEHDMLEYIKNIIGDISKNFKGAEEYFEIINNFHDLNDLMVYIAPYFRVTQAEKQTLVEIRSNKARGLKFMDYLIAQEESIKLQIEMAERFNNKANKNYREAYLREQLKAIQDELNEGKSKQGSNGKDYREEIENSTMPEDVKKVALEELGKLEMMGPQSAETHVIRNYLDLLIALPWDTSNTREIDIELARKVLNEQHYGLDKVKDRIIQHLAVMKLKKEKKGTILLLVGPPGTGKTSLGKSIASALEREYVRISLGGIRDEAEIRGHRRTYVGALPGRIIQGMKKAKAKNPVFVLDEVDKLMRGYSGDPASALLEVLDPEQNNTFADHYLEVPYDLSEVFFLATANDLGSIPRPLLDRMEVIQLSSYTNKEKQHIGTNHLVKKVLAEHGLTEKQLVITPEIVEEIIEKYTMEAGVRGLNRRIETLARVASEKIVAKKVELPFEIKAEMLEEFLGKKSSKT